MFPVSKSLVMISKARVIGSLAAGTGSSAPTPCTTATSVAPLSSPAQRFRRLPAPCDPARSWFEHGPDSPEAGLKHRTFARSTAPSSNGLKGGGRLFFGAFLQFVPRE